MIKEKIEWYDSWEEYSVCKTASTVRAWELRKSQRYHAFFPMQSVLSRVFTIKGINAPSVKHIFSLFHWPVPNRIFPGSNLQRYRSSNKMSLKNENLKEENSWRLFRVSFLCDRKILYLQNMRSSFVAANRKWYRFLSMIHFFYTKRTNKVVEKQNVRNNWYTHLLSVSQYQKNSCAKVPKTNSIIKGLFDSLKQL